MPEDILPFDKSRDPALSRRAFAALSLGAGAAVTASAMAADGAVVETDVVINMPDGSCDAALFHPAGSGSWPGAVIFTDALGLRPAFRDMGRRLAAEGYTVLVPNPFFRTRKAPVLSGPFDFGKPEDRAKLTELMAPLPTTEIKTRDGTAYITYLDTLPQVNAKAWIGVSGYCMGGAYTMFTAAAAAERVGARGLVPRRRISSRTSPTARTCSPQRSRPAMYFGIAANDDRAPAGRQGQADARPSRPRHMPAKIEVYEGCQHGWCVSDGMVYKKTDADRAFGELVALYKKALV